MPLASLLNIQHCSVQRPNRIEENEREETTYHCLYWKEEGEKKTVNSWEMYSSSRSPFLFLLLLGFAEESLKVRRALCRRRLCCGTLTWSASLPISPREYRNLVACHSRLGIYIGCTSAQDSAASQLPLLRHLLPWPSGEVSSSDVAVYVFFSFFSVSLVYLSLLCNQCSLAVELNEQLCM